MGKKPGDESESKREMLYDAQSMNALNSTIKAMKVSSPGSRGWLVCMVFSSLW
jgi:hypothetical protein